MAVIPSQLDNLKIEGIQNASIALFSNVARQMQITYGSNSAGWTNTLQSLNNVVTADNIRVLKLDTLSSTQYIANSIVTYGDGTFVNQANIETISASVPSNFTTANGIIIKAVETILHEKTFANTSVESYTSNVVALNTFISGTLDQNAIYLGANITSTLDYALQNGHLTNWNNLSLKDFNLSTETNNIQDLSESEFTRIQSMYASTYL
jgi:hypothetical protein